VHDFSMIRYIALAESTTSYGYIRDHLVKEGVRLTPTARVDDFDTANVFVELGLGHAIVPAVHGYHFEQAHRVKALPIHGMPPIRVGWAARQFRLLPPMAHDFMAIFLHTTQQWQDIPGLQVLQSERVVGAGV